MDETAEACTDSTDFRGGADGTTASLADIAIRRRGRDRSPPARKLGDITDALRKIPAEAEVLGRHASVEPAAMRDVTPPRADGDRATEPLHRSRAQSGAAERRGTGDDPLALWKALRASGRLPMRQDFEADLATGRWPGAVLLRFDPVSQSIEGAASRMTPPSDRAREQEAVPVDAEHSAMVTGWMMRVARRAGGGRQPLSEQASFPCRTGMLQYRLVALPLGEGGRVDHILCHLVRPDTRVPDRQVI